MKKEDIAVLEEVFSDVLEQTAFMFTDELSQDNLDMASLHDTDFIQAFITFTGPFNGLISITFPEDLCYELAANILGEELNSELVRSEGQGAVGELLNVVCGQFLTTVEDEKLVFDLSVPLIEDFNIDEWISLEKQETSALIEVEEHPVLIHFDI